MLLSLESRTDIQHSIDTTSRPTIGKQRTVRQMVNDSAGLVESPTVLVVSRLESERMAQDAASLLLGMDHNMLSVLNHNGKEKRISFVKSSSTQIKQENTHSPYSPFNNEVENPSEIPAVHRQEATDNQPISSLYPEQNPEEISPI
eukprot:CAMPEP_0182427590 /NCGR_PEP_ID=MMETSP1167-20130531/18830_1 /TAXON_ID=2988 /ORGANISM="Mallomonas Sp, Strain CCMP3275" /LENGTH=145 /DNA_ID=CAMNT_0024609925 /DNA_START=251 /DNA_END=688 /DNA_ORIENTATION=-